MAEPFWHWPFGKWDLETLNPPFHPKLLLELSIALLCTALDNSILEAQTHPPIHMLFFWLVRC